MDTIIILSCCPMDLAPINRADCRISDIDAEVFD